MNKMKKSDLKIIRQANKRILEVATKIEKELYSYDGGIYQEGSPYKDVIEDITWSTDSNGDWLILLNYGVERFCPDNSMNIRGVHLPLDIIIEGNCEKYIIEKVRIKEDMDAQIKAVNDARVAKNNDKKKSEKDELKELRAYKKTIERNEKKK